VSLSLYMDVHVPYAVTAGLMARGVDVITAQWDQTDRWSDPELLDRSTALARVLVSQDEDLLSEAARRQRNGTPFAGIVFATQTGITIGRFIDDLALLAKVLDAAEMENRVEFLPL
jgi:predicted nuclease of predicted toxin-antitoxin system